MLNSHLFCPRNPKCPQHEGRGEMLQMLSAITRTVEKGEEKKMAWSESDDRKKIAAHKLDIGAPGGGTECHFSVI